MVHSRQLMARTHQQNVKDGDLTTGSTDAVNGSQLKTTNDGRGDEYHQYRH